MELPLSSSGRSAREVAIHLAREAGQVLLHRFRGEKRVFYKGRGNITTDVDTQVEALILEGLRREFPGFGLLAEETAHTPSNSPYLWVVDPLDGTRNYASGIPFFSLVIALAYQGEVVLGLTYDPVRGEVFLAEKGKGAYLNGRPIAVSRRERVEECILGFDMGYNDLRARHTLEMVLALWPGMQTVRVMGSSALGLAYAAAGRVDIYFHPALAPWDLASGHLLVREAGGVAVDHHGRPATLFSPSVIATSPRLLGRFLQATQGLAWREVGE